VRGDPQNTPSSLHLSDLAGLIREHNGLALCDLAIVATTSTSGCEERMVITGKDLSFVIMGLFGP
jgi:hypothetical protein